MSLFGSIQMGANTLRAMQIGLQVVGNNIANANTPGFVREEVIYKPAPVQTVGSLQLGLGVLVHGIVQQVDEFVQSRLYGARGDRADAEIQEKAYQDLEVLIGELSDTDISTSLSGFFNSIDAILQNPGDVSIRNLTVLKGQTLTQDFNRLYDRVANVRDSINEQVIAASDEINDLTEEIRLLNIRITESEGGEGAKSEAGGLRSRRQVAVDRLSEIIDVAVSEQASGGLSVSVGGETLVIEGQRKEVEIAESDINGFNVSTVQFVTSKSDLRISGGELNGLYTARDDIVGGFLNDLDELTATLAFEFNKLYSQGQGLIGYQQVTSIEAVNDPQAALDAAGLTFTPSSGSFDLLVRNKNTGLTDVHTIQVNLDGIDEDTSLADLAADLDAIDGISASVSNTGELVINAESANADFAFDGDDSGVLAALGINTFFTGSNARDLGVNPLLQDERLFAASGGGVDADTVNAEALAVFYDRDLEAADGSSIADLYSRMVNVVTQGSTISQSEGSLEGEALAVSGVNLDEEAIRMIMLQRTYQAAARHIQTVSELLDILVSL
jgi:flagellar hook-associated protein 1 FlgK